MTNSNNNQTEGKRRMSSMQEENGDGRGSFSSRQLALSVIMLLVGVLYYYYRFSAIRNNRDAAAAKHHLMNESILKMKDSIKHALIHYSLPRVQEAQNHRLTVAIGYNSNVDLITKALPVVNRLIEVEKDNFDQDQLQKMEFTVVNESFCDTLTSVPQFIACFTHFFKGGNGVERFVLNETMFHQIVSSASTNVSHEFNIGGNAALMAVKFAKEQWKKVYLTGGSIGTQLKQLLSEYSDKIQFVTPSTTTAGNDSNDDDKGEEKDEIHLIMEYDKNEAFAGYLTPRANRFIVTRDISNAEFHSLDEFHSVIDRNLNEIDLIVLSGFHLLDGETDVRKRRLVLEKISNKVSETYRMCNGRRSKKHDDLIMIHLELASIGQQVIYNEIGKYIFPFVHSLGLNEQELSSLYEALIRRMPVNDDLLSTGAGAGVGAGGVQEQSAVSPPPPLEKLRSIAQVIPNIAQVTMALNHIMNTFHSSLQRVHFHSLAYHLLVVRNVDSTNDNNKSNNKHRDAANLAAVSSSSLAACTQACGFQSHQDIGADKVDVLFQWHEHESLIQKYFHLFSNVRLIGDIIGDGDDTVEQANSLVQWTSQNGAYTFYLAPVLVCKQTIKTVGLGDAISTAGLSAQLKVERHHFDKRRSK